VKKENEERDGVWYACVSAPPYSHGTASYCFRCSDGILLIKWPIAVLLTTLSMAWCAIYE